MPVNSLSSAIRLVETDKFAELIEFVELPEFLEFIGFVEMTSLLRPSGEGLAMTPTTSLRGAEGDEAISYHSARLLRHYVSRNDEEGGSDAEGEGSGGLISAWLGRSGLCR